MANILVCDDDKEIVDAIEIYLSQDGYKIYKAYDGEQAIQILDKEEIHLLIMDIMMPKLDGIQAMIRIREKSNVPVILLTAKGEDSDKVLGLTVGADDYITKPFNILELKARIRALIRRSSMAPAAPAEPDGGKLVRGHIEIDPERRSARRFGQNVELTLKEFDLIELLMRNPGKVYSREQLLDLVWGYDYQGDIRTVDVHIRRLREKLERNPAAPEYIITKWGVGYYFAEA